MRLGSEHSKHVALQKSAMASGIKPAISPAPLAKIASAAAFPCPGGRASRQEDSLPESPLPRARYRVACGDGRLLRSGASVMASAHAQSGGGALRIGGTMMAMRSSPSSSSRPRFSTTRRIMAEGDASIEAGEAGPAEKTKTKKREYLLPSTLEESIDQARTASRQAIRDGVKRLQLEVLLPLIGATDLDDWPGGIQQQFKAAGPVITSLLNGLIDGDSSCKQDGGCRKYIMDDSDAVGAWESDEIALVLFPTAESLSSVEALVTGNQDRPLLLVNAQWQSGQVISDFGFGAQKRAREEFVNSFEVVYFLKQMRMFGEDVRLLKRYPGDWQVFVIDTRGGSECVAVEAQRPSYKALEGILKSRKGSKAGQGWLSRLFSEFEFNQNSLKE